MSKPGKQRDSRKTKRFKWGYILWPLIFMILVATGWAALQVKALNGVVVDAFNNALWELPARVYARAQDLYPDKPINVDDLVWELEQLNYLAVDNPVRPGEYAVRGGEFRIFFRAFKFPEEYQPQQLMRLTVRNQRILSMEAVDTGEPIFLFRMEPLRIASIYPKHNEDRVLVKQDEVPPFLRAALLSVEDQDFYQHHGVQPKAIIRAMVANYRAGRAVQGGSTLTQQLVKNFFLTNERTITRKAKEAIMALILEWHFDKDKILEAYLNEINLGQDGARAIHGFGLASQFFFQRPLEDLEKEHIALLVGLAKGPSWYEPRRRPERAKTRRNIVLDLLVEQQHLSPEEAEQLKQKPLGVTKDVPSGVTSYPAYLKLVREQLKADYSEEELQDEGLEIFTTLNPVYQHYAEQAVSHRLKQVEKQRRLESDSLQGALLLAAVESGEILALVGDRNPRYPGFNRVLDMKRHVGSLIKPAVYLTALLQPERFNLATLVDDTEYAVELTDGRWTPKNFGHKEHGQVALLTALTHSYNIATARLGNELVGLDPVIDTLRKLGIKSPLNKFPSILLGATELTPLEMLQMYQTLASGGTRTPLRAILEVIDPDDGEKKPRRYALEVNNVLPAEQVFLTTYAMQQVTRVGTARRLPSLLPRQMNVAGKTGTTNNSRDSWFAGFTGEHVSVAWVGRDDNQPMKLTGSQGGMLVWADLIKRLPSEPLRPLKPNGVEWTRVDMSRGMRLPAYCDNGSVIPFIVSAPLPIAEDCFPYVEQFDEQGESYQGLPIFTD